MPPKKRKADLPSSGPSPKRAKLDGTPQSSSSAQPISSALSTPELTTHPVSAPAPEPGDPMVIDSSGSGSVVASVPLPPPLPPPPPPATAPTPITSLQMLQRLLNPAQGILSERFASQFEREDWNLLRVLNRVVGNAPWPNWNPERDPLALAVGSPARYLRVRCMNELQPILQLVTVGPGDVNPPHKMPREYALRGGVVRSDGSYELCGQNERNSQYGGTTEFYKCQAWEHWQRPSTTVPVRPKSDWMCGSCATRNAIHLQNRTRAIIKSRIFPLCSACSHTFHLTYMGLTGSYEDYLCRCSPEYPVDTVACFCMDYVETITAMEEHRMVDVARISGHSGRNYGHHDGQPELYIDDRHPDRNLCRCGDTYAQIQQSHGGVTHPAQILDTDPPTVYRYCAACSGHVTSQQLQYLEQYYMNTTI